jgi:hypothetical protein
MRICSGCGAENASQNAFCSACGLRLGHEILLMDCPRCRRVFEVSLWDDRGRFRSCSRCDRRYPDRYRRCPYCPRPAGRTRRPPVRETPRAAPVGSFSKKDYRPLVKTFDIRDAAADRSFGRVVIHHRKSGEHAAILNRIKVDAGKGWLDYAQGLRLKEGRNEFSVPVPRGAFRLLLAFDHGKGAEIRIELE